MQAAWETWEGFWVAGRRRGAVRRVFDDGLLTTRVGFLDASGTPFASESLVRLSDDGTTWQAFRYRQEPGSVSAGARRAEAGLGPDTLPASGEHLLVALLEESGRDRTAYLRVDEGCPDEPAAPAEAVRAGTEPVELPDGRSVTAERIDIVAGGVRVASHWLHAGRAVRSAWAGALAFACADEGEALEGLDDGLRAFLQDGFGAD
ncbi:hypothetical protein [Sinomonas halotolerans]|uniref:Uncharacterized protein n=1 Tax=Sinomonas halotolerans TaxID=1644133 RepID=A0ABU9X2J5_9MICC